MFTIYGLRIQVQFIIAGHALQFCNAYWIFKDVEITNEILHSNQQILEQQPNIRFDQNFDIQVKQITSEHPKMNSIKIQGFEKILKYTTVPMGGVA